MTTIQNPVALPCPRTMSGWTAWPRRIVGREPSRHDAALYYQSFQWARDFKHLVFQANFQPLYRRSGVSDYYVYGLGDGSLQLAAKGARTGELSPDGNMLGVERAGDMYIEDLATHNERRLTTDATELVFNGHFDWVYEEEFGMAQAWNWSPDSRHIAFWQINESKEPVIQLSDFSGPHPEWDQIRIPQPGDSNPRACRGGRFAQRQARVARSGRDRRVLHPAHLLDESR